MEFKRWLPEGCICLHARLNGPTRIPMSDCPIHAEADARLGLNANLLQREEFEITLHYDPPPGYVDPFQGAN